MARATLDLLDLGNGLPSIGDDGAVTSQLAPSGSISAVKLGSLCTLVLVGLDGTAVGIKLVYLAEGDAGGPVKDGRRACSL